ncbi:MAG: phosphoenolpyruvate--protein phosphotransferase [Moraxellaceae bacterium]|nr:phosphoenolpyruvate--protein phosphotransferase [Moraxellaceae bacterium]
MKLTADLVLIGQQPSNKSIAITTLAKTLANANKVDIEYLEGFLQREQVANTYLGKGIAIPHGVPELRHLIKETAVAVMQVPEGVAWGDNGEKVHLIVAIVAQGDEHLQVLKKLTRLFSNQDTLNTLFSTTNPNVICNALNDEQVAIDMPTEKTVSEFDGQTFAYQKSVTLPNPQGMHARPASKLQKLVTDFNTLVVLETADGKRIDASKMFDILGLGLEKDSVLTVMSDDEQVTNQVVSAITLGLGDDLNLTMQPTQKKIREYLWQADGEIETLKGVGASDGLVIGKIQHYGQPTYQIPTTVKSTLEEITALDNALQQAKNNIETLMNSDNLGTDEMAIFQAHLSILNDADVVKEAVAYISQGKNAVYAYKTVSDARIEQLANVDNEHISARASDIRDVQTHVMNALLGIETTENNFAEPVILCAKDLTPSDTMKLSADTILGFITETGGATSHSAIIARNMGLPAIVATGEGLSKIANGTQVIMDGKAGLVYLNPNEQQILSAQQAQEKLLKKQQQANAYRDKKGQTKDGHKVEICANINEAEDIANGIELGAEGVGLMRTEMLYLSSKSIPSEDFQYEKYRAMAKALANKPLIIRTLDIGGDKEVSYLGLVREDNAFLGMRGIRLCFQRPDLFIPQLRAICRVAKEFNNVHVMFPMISKLSDWHQAKQILDEVREQMQAPKFPVGIMVEVPSTALIAHQFAEHVDFFSIGTNDLTQYTLATDRMHPILAEQADALHPAVLQLIHMTVQSAHKQGKWVGVCGNSAGDIASAKILVGLGIDELSMSPTQIATVKQTLDHYNYSELQEIAKQALAQESAIAVREFMAKH